jgi:hypothetical protein
MTKREANLKPLFTWRSAVASPYGPPDPTTRLVLLTLGLRVNGFGELTVPTVAELAIESGLREEVVELHLRIAAEQGWLEWLENGEYALSAPPGLFDEE